MKPRLKLILPEDSAAAGSVGDIGIERIKISKMNRTVLVDVDRETPPPVKDMVINELKRTYRLRDADLEIREPENTETSNTIVRYVSRDNYEKNTSAQQRKQYIGRAHVGEMLYGRLIREQMVPISSINENSGKIAFRGDVFALEYKDITSKKNQKQYHIVNMDVTDYEDSISVQLFITKTDEDETFLRFKEKLRVGMGVVIRGEASFNNYANEVIVTANAVAVGKKVLPRRMDNAPMKRVELHMHTKMSTMDGVSDAKELINRAIEWGHSAVAITDHGVVQSYPDAMKASGNNEKIKILYGVEGYLIDDSKKITENAGEEDITSSFVVFDIETTGLYKDVNKITEIGAVKIENGRITDRWSTFVNPEESIPENIIRLTGITDEMVAGAPTIDKVLPSFLDFCKGCVLVAQNASFDIGFIKKNAADCGLEYNFCHTDTLILARCLHPELSNYRLDTLSRHYKVILENHHRAVDDAKATADIFLCMLEELKALGLTKLKDLNSHFDIAAASKKNKAFHIILLAKNQIGLRHIYEMVSKSHLDYYFRTPRIPRSLLVEKREGVIVGSACEAGELFRAVVEGESDERLREIAEFYDYLEIQPIGNNAYMKRADDHPHINSDEDLMNLNRRVVRLGEELNKPVCATCDVHFLDPLGANFRKILMNYMHFKDADEQAPLYFRTTEEMLEEFDYLGKEKAYEVVVKNTNKIADMIENVRPIPKEKCPPVVDGAEEAIVNDSLAKAKRIYGDPLPKIVQDRLDKELHSITTYGFSVMYRIAQELVRKSLSDGYLVGSRGSVGSSLVAFLSDITEVNSLPAHYVCPNCHNSEFIEDGSGISGCDLPDKICPKCGTMYKKDGHDIPFETFLGFKGDKEPDIDLNFSGDYQPVIHKYTETFFGEGYVFRAGTIGTVAEKTAYGYVQRYAEDRGITIRNAEKRRLAAGCVGVKRTTGQHPGGIIVVPYTNDIHEFCPIQHPADDPNSDIITTHFDYHSIDKNLLKLDELGHDDPTVIRMLMDLTGVDAQKIPLDDKPTMSLFTSTDALNLKEKLETPVGTYGVPEFGTKFVRQMLVDTKPTTFAELVRISGLSHGTDVWLNNAQDLIRNGTTTLSNAICCRDDIMIYLIHMGVEAGHAFQIMEKVRKGKGLAPEDEEAMRAANVPEWYLTACKKIGYMFPKAHAVAYVTMAFRIAYFKVHHPEAFYIAYFSVRADDFDASIMARGIDVARAAIEDIKARKKDGTAKPKEEGLIPILEICVEMYARGIDFVPVGLYTSHATDFLKTDKGILPPLSALPGLGDNAARAITEAREDGPFKTIEELRQRTGATRATIDILQENHCLDGMPESDQVSLFDFM